MTDTPGSLSLAGGCNAAEPFALQVLGDSMLPEFEHGAIIVVDPGGLIEDGAYVVAQHAGEYMLRRLRRPERRYVLEALNAQYPAVEIDGIESIVGVVVQKAGRRRRDRKHYV